MLLRDFYLFGHFWFFLSLTSAYSQDLHIEENQLLTTSTGAVVCVNGSVVNNGSIINQGIIQLGGNWNNTNSYSGSGWLQLTSSDEQSIQHNNQTVASLSIDGGGSKVLQGSISVLDTLNLINGLLTTTSEDHLLLESGAFVSEANSSSYVLGPIRFRGTGYHYLPVGSAAEFLPMILEDVEGVNPVVEVEAVSDNPLEVNGEKLEKKIVNNQWTISVLEGSYDRSLVTLAVTSSDNFNDLSGIVVTESDDLNATFNNLGQSLRQGNPENGFITSSFEASKTILALGLTSEYVIENSVEIPSAFSPNAPDPLDRTVKVYSNSLSSQNFSFTIFNRWGQIVYQTNDLQQAQNLGWDGTSENSSQLMPSGVYTFVLKGTYDSGRLIEKSGSISLFQ